MSANFFNQEITYGGTDENADPRTIGGRIGALDS
jgi:hypothetical protein